MNWLDVVVFSTLGIRTWFGYRRGFIHQVFGLVGLIAGLFVAAGYYSSLQRVLFAYIKLPFPILAVVAFLLLLMGVMLVARILSHICTNFFRVPGLGFLNACSGALLGALVSLLVMALILSVLQLFSIAAVETALSTSLVAPYLEKYTPLFFDFLDEHLPSEEIRRLSPPGESVPIDRREL